MEALAIIFGLLFWALAIAVCAGLYFLPTIIAVVQHRSNVALIAVINFFLGWSFVGWIVALVLALTKESQPIQVVQVQQHVGYPMMGQQPNPQQYRSAQYTRGAQVVPSDHYPMPPAHNAVPLPEEPPRP